MPGLIMHQLVGLFMACSNLKTLHKATRRNSGLPGEEMKVMLTSDGVWHTLPGTQSFAQVFLKRLEKNFTADSYCWILMSQKNSWPTI